MPKKKAGGAGEAAEAAVKKRARSRTGGAAKKTRGAESSAAPAAPAAPATAPALRIKQIRSGIGHAYTYRRTLEALGLKYHQDEVVLRDHPSVRGMLHKVRDFVRVQPVEG